MSSINKSKSFSVTFVYPKYGDIRNNVPLVKTKKHLNKSFLKVPTCTQYAKKVK